MVKDLERIFHYFPQLTELQKDQFTQMGPLYLELNQQVNVISRKDIQELYIKHILHSLAIAKFTSFVEDTELVDLGTGGGFPGLPLAILFPQCRFLLIDGTAKKIGVVNEVIQALGLQNAVGYQKRSEELKQTFDYVLARAVTRMNKLIPQCRHLISKNHRNALPNGLITLKGGDLTEELQEVNKQGYFEQVALIDYYEEEFFETKSLVYAQL